MSAGRCVERLGLSRETLKGRVAVVTGAGRGIGREVAFALAWLGARVVLAELAEADGLETERLVREAGAEALFVPTDVAEEESVAGLGRRAREAFGPPDILINNAIFSPVASVLEMDLDTWDRVMAVNLRGAFLTCKAFLPDMVRMRRGTIVNLITGEALPHLSAYTASKQGLLGFSQSLAAEVGEAGVRVVAFGPGMVATPGLLGAAARLAPRLGMTEREFLGLRLHPAYEGLMPADHAGAAAAYLVAVLAGEYHGEQVLGYEILERAGVIGVRDEAVAPGPAPAGGTEPCPAGAVGTAVAAGAGREETLRAALALCDQVDELITRTGAEFGGLPAFVRPFARRGFRDRTGLTVQEWAAEVSRLHQRLAAARAGDRAQQDALRAGSGAWRERLANLAAYCQAVPGETARYVKDPAVLRDLGRKMAEREATVRQLAETLDRI